MGSTKWSKENEPPLQKREDEGRAPPAAALAISSRQYLGDPRSNVLSTSLSMSLARPYVWRKRDPRHLHIPRVKVHPKVRDIIQGDTKIGHQ